MLRLASDADVHGEIIRGLRRRMPEIDLTRVQDALGEGIADEEVEILRLDSGPTTSGTAPRGRKHGDLVHALLAHASFPPRPG